MGLILFLVVGCFVVFGLHLWLLVSIWKVSPLGAIFTFLFWPVSIYFLITTWSDEEINIKTPFFAGFIAYSVLIGVGVSVATAHYADHVRAMKAAQQVQRTTESSHSDMDSWCQKQDGAVYSAALGTCVEASPDAKK